MTEEETAEDERFEEVAPPRDIRIETDTRGMYEDLRSTEGSPFENAQLIQIYLNAAAVGSEQGLRRGIEGETRALFNVSSLSDRQRTHVRSIAWKETHDREIYYNHKQAFKIVTEFANGGIRYLHQNYLGMGDNLNEASTELIQRWKNFESELEERGLLSEDT
jgi:hypothetical protein